MSEVELIAALAKTRNVLRAAATHTLGCLASRAAIAIFKDLLTSSEDLVKVESAYALARLGVFEGKEVLVQCLEYPLDAYLFPAIAAGYLAQLGDPQGFNTIVKCFGVDISAIRMLACKQLYFFVPFHGVQDKDGNAMDVFCQFDRALKDSDSSIQWQALIQLREICSPKSRTLLASALRPLPGEARGVVKSIHGWQRRFLATLGTRFVFSADELYLESGMRLPTAAAYEGFTVAEDGVGLVRGFEDGWTRAPRRAPRRLGGLRAVTLVTGTMFAPRLERLLSRLSTEGLTTTVVPIVNDWFVPRIQVAGLLTGQDIQIQLAGRPLGDEVLVPAVALRDGAGVFLDDLSVGVTKPQRAHLPPGWPMKYLVWKTIRPLH